MHETAEACEVILELTGVEKEAPTSGAKTTTSKSPQAIAHDKLEA